MRGAGALSALVLLSAGAALADPLDVPLSELTANPAAYEGQVVRTSGLMHDDFSSGPAIYPDEASARDHDAGRSMAMRGGLIGGPARELRGSNVVVTGRVEPGRFGHMAEWQWAITDVSELATDPTAAQPGPLWEIHPHEWLYMGALILCGLVAMLAGWLRVVRPGTMVAATRPGRRRRPGRFAGSG